MDQRRASVFSPHSFFGPGVFGGAGCGRKRGSAARDGLHLSTHGPGSNRHSKRDRRRAFRLPPWAAEFGCDGWAQFALKFIVSHPAVTCAIPATSSVAHVRQNLGAARGVLPDAAMRARMAAHVAAL